MEEVRVENVSMVIPASPSNPHCLFLSALDLFWIRFKGIRRLFFFETTLQSQHLELLKSSLSDVLADFNAVAGRLTKNEDTGRTEINCNNKGVEFIEASIDVNFQHLRDGHFQHTDFFDKLAPQFKVLMDGQGNVDPDAPLLSVQVTRFEGGGMCLGTAFEHVLGDGKSYCHFMSSWGELARGRACISVKPLYARELFMLDNRTKEDGKMMDYRAVSMGNGSEILKVVRVDKNTQEPSPGKKTNVSEDHKDLARKKTNVSEDHKDLARKKMVLRRFELGEETVRSLKMRSEARSSFVGVAAHLWKWSMIAMMPELALEGKVGILFLMDYISRISMKGKSLSMENYFGNSVVPVKVSGKARDVVERDTEHTAKVIERAIDECATEKYIWEFIAWMEGLGKGGDLGDAVKRVIGANSEWMGGVFISGSHTFPVYAVDFGWGKPEAVEVASLNHTGSVHISPTKSVPAGMGLSTRLPLSYMLNFQSLVPPA